MAKFIIHGGKPLSGEIKVAGSKNAALKIFPAAFKKLLTCDITTHEHPGFVTDLQSPYTVLMTQACGSSLIHETI